MNSTFLTILFLCFFSITSFAQHTASINGTVVDTASNVKLLNASVSILRSKDSTLVKFTRVNENGVFAFKNLPRGNFFLLVTYPGYADYAEPFKLDSLKDKLDFGKIKLTPIARLLQDVIIKGKATAVKIKGDTTEFNASSYTIQPNSKVEDLLKQLPGIQVDKDGKITAQGQAVKKVLLDGEEFFGDDPTLVTKNIRGDMVDKVQLYDKKSDQAAFTGIDDGKKEKTINIKLKEDKKKGYFGKLDGGGGNDQYYQGKAMINIFQAKKKFSAFGTLANNGQNGLGWEDNNKYGSTSNFEFGDNNIIMISGGGRDELDSYDGSYRGEGIPVTKNGGAHYDSKWNSDKEQINANYKIGSIQLEGVKNTISQNNLPTGIINTTNDQAFEKQLFRQKADVMYQINLDSTSTLKVSVDGTLKNGKNNTSYSAKSLQDGFLLNESERTLSNESHDKGFNARALWTKKLKKTGRTLSLTLAQAVTNSDNKGFLNSKNDFFNRTGAQDSSQLVDQFKTSLVKSTDFRSNLAYTEPLSKTLSVIVSYGFGINNSSANRKSFNKAGDGNYSLLDTIYSNNYKLDQVSNQGGLTFNYKKNKTFINIGTNVSNVSFDQLDVYKQTSFKRNFINWNPRATYRYNMSQRQSLSLEYTGNTVQPSIEQIQPVRINTDPLNITLGNPDLRTAFRSNMNLWYNSYKVMSGQNMYLGANYNFTVNPIVNNTFTDSTGKSTFQSINLTSKKPFNYSVFMGYGQKINSLDMNIGASLNNSGNVSYSLINDALNKTTTNSYGGRLNFYKNKEKKYNSSASFGPAYTSSQSSLQKQINDNGWGFNGSFDFKVYLPAKFEIESDANYQYRAKTKSFNEDFSRMIINASVGRKFLKSEALKLSFAVNDLLNQNKGFNRSAYGNMITQNSYTTIQRYFFASISWDFNKMGGSAPKK